MYRMYSAGYIVLYVFFMKKTATTEIYTYRHTLSLHDARPISVLQFKRHGPRRPQRRLHRPAAGGAGAGADRAAGRLRLLAAPLALAGRRRRAVAAAHREHGLLGGDHRDPGAGAVRHRHLHGGRSEEHTSELQSLMRTSYAVFCLKKKNTQITR